MTGQPVLFLLAVIALCLVVITILALQTAAELRRTLRRVNTLLPSAGRMLRQTSQLLDAIHRISHQVESLVTKASGAASQTVDGLLGLKVKLAHLFTQTMRSQGARSGSRSVKNRLKGRDVE